VALVALLAAIAVTWKSQPAPPRTIVVAVLPLENLSADADQEYFADGMTDTVLTGLARISGLRVIARTSVLPYKRARKSLSEIVQRLGATHIVEGTVLRDGGRLRITAQLIDGATGHHLWAESYVRDLKDVLSLQDDVARSIARAVNVADSAGRARTHGRKQTHKPGRPGTLPSG
jgi:TolB-like protein